VSRTISVEFIQEYLEALGRRHGIVAAMVCGSYGAKTMKAHSDVDVFCVSTDPDVAVRGREFFQGVEFEYFLSPEWKYYDRMDADPVSVAIYAGGIILLDRDRVLEKIQRVARGKKEAYRVEWSDEQKCDAAFFLDTIWNDALDLFQEKDYSSFQVMCLSNIERIVNLLCKLHDRLPLHSKHYLRDLPRVDSVFCGHLTDFLQAELPDKLAPWEKLHRHVLRLLGDPDVSNYRSIESLRQEAK
jgi:hypothetical protein